MKNKKSKLLATIEFDTLKKLNEDSGAFRRLKEKERNYLFGSNLLGLSSRSFREFSEFGANENQETWNRRESSKHVFSFRYSYGLMLKLLTIKSNLHGRMMTKKGEAMFLDENCCSLTDTQTLPTNPKKFSSVTSLQIKN